MKKCLIMFAFLVLVLSIAVIMDRQDQAINDKGYAINQVDTKLLSDKAKAND